jgi:hypothetical protein
MNKLEHLLIIDNQVFPVFDPHKLHPFTDKTLSPYFHPALVIFVKNKS